MKALTTTVLCSLMVAGMSAFAVAGPMEIVNDTLSDSKAVGARDGLPIADRTPDKANLPGGKWIVKGTRAAIRAGGGEVDPDHFFPESTGILHDSQGTLAIPISSQGSYSKPRKLTISADFVACMGGKPALGFYSALPDMDNKEPMEKNFSGLIATIFGVGPDNGTLDLYENGKKTVTVKYTENFDQTEMHRLSYDVDTTTGAISNVKFTGSTSDYSAFKTTAFTDAATAYAAIGMGPGPSGRTLDNVSVSDFRVGVDLAPSPDLPKRSPVKPGLILCLKAADYDPKTTIWKDSSGNGRDAIDDQIWAKASATLDTKATPNGSPAVEFRHHRLMIKPIDISKSFTILMFLNNMTVPPKDPREGHSGFLVGELAGVLGYKLDRNKQFLCEAWGGTDFGTSNTEVKLNEWSMIGVSGTVGKSATFRLNGADDGTIKFSKSFVSNTYTTRLCDFFEGKIAEIRVYNTELTTKEIEAVEAEFKASYVAPKVGGAAK